MGLFLASVISRLSRCARRSYHRDLRSKFVHSALRTSATEATLDSGTMDAKLTHQHRMCLQLASLHRFLMEVSLHCQPQQTRAGDSVAVGSSARRKGMPATHQTSPALASTAASGITLVVLYRWFLLELIDLSFYAGVRSAGATLSVRDSPLTLWLGGLLACDHQVNFIVPIIQ